MIVMELFQLTSTYIPMDGNNKYLLYIIYSLKNNVIYSSAWPIPSARAIVVLYQRKVVDLLRTLPSTIQSCGGRVSVNTAMINAGIT